MHVLEYHCRPGFEPNVREFPLRFTRLYRYDTIRYRYVPIAGQPAFTQVLIKPHRLKVLKWGRDAWGHSAYSLHLREYCTEILLYFRHSQRYQNSFLPLQYVSLSPLLLSCLQSCTFTQYVTYSVPYSVHEPGDLCHQPRVADQG